MLEHNNLELEKITMILKKSSLLIKKIRRVLNVLNSTNHKAEGPRQ